ncbi:MAG: hypothetical protein [Caudoviricetes sp.]|nr:MAG: hypothetical protein [Caudoviricetes sp.]
MTTWNYIKGSEKDFEGAPDWALYRDEWDNEYFWSEGYSVGDRFKGVSSDDVWRYGGNEDASTIIAHRESVTDVTAVKNDVVNHPSHYTQGGIECIDAIKAATVGKTGIDAVCVANVVKYLWRYEEKNGLEDVKKARWYLERLINELESNK